MNQIVSRKYIHMLLKVVSEGKKQVCYQADSWKKAGISDSRNSQESSPSRYINGRQVRKSTLVCECSAWSMAHTQPASNTMDQYRHFNSQTT